MVACYCGLFPQQHIKGLPQVEPDSPSHGPDPTLMGPDSNFTSHGPDSTHITPNSTLYGRRSTRIEARFHLTWALLHSHRVLIPPCMGLIAVALGPDSTRMGPIPPCVGLIPVKLFVEGFLLMIKPSFSFFCFPFLPCYLAGVMGKTEKWGGGGP